MRRRKTNADMTGTDVRSPTFAKIENVVVASDRLYRSARKVIQEAHGVVSRVANWTMVETNWCGRNGIITREAFRKGVR